MDLRAILETTCKKEKLPALGACLIVDGEIGEAIVVGTRRLGGDEPATSSDAFQIGSCTKAMTATLVGQLVEKKLLRFETTLGEVFSFTPEPWKQVSVAHLLAHRSGLGERMEPKGTEFNALHAKKASERLAWLRTRLADAPESAPGEKYVYSNAGYTALGVLCEAIAKKPWEALIRERLFLPLGMASAGFGVPPTLWQHPFRGGKLAPLAPKEGFDNPPIMAPAGGVHLSLSDWARFALRHVSEATPMLRRLHIPEFGGTYAGGWIVVRGQPWAGGDALSHGGSNTMNYAVVWIAPKKRLAVLCATNAYRPGIEKVMNDVVLAGLKEALR
jgi:CubicO group peptidase (beta-lactamase class C family)